jgi:hypothetical protein
MNKRNVMIFGMCILGLGAMISGTTVLTGGPEGLATGGGQAMLAQSQPRSGHHHAGEHGHWEDVWIPGDPLPAGPC